jgi:hypothetical protein
VSAELCLRMGKAGDAAALQGLAERDSRRPPDGPVLVAESGGKLLAALALRSGETIADPFEPTAHLVAALRAHAAAGQSERREPWRRERPCAQPQPAI